MRFRTPRRRASNWARKNRLECRDGRSTGPGHGTPGFPRATDRSGLCRGPFSLGSEVGVGPGQNLPLVQGLKAPAGFRVPRRRASNWAKEEPPRRPRPPAAGRWRRRSRFPWCRRSVRTFPWAIFHARQSGRRPKPESASRTNAAAFGRRGRHGVFPETRQRNPAGQAAKAVPQAAVYAAAMSGRSQGSRPIRRWPCSVFSVVGVRPCQNLLDPDRPVKVDLVPIELGQELAHEVIERRIPCQQLALRAGL